MPPEPLDRCVAMLLHSGVTMPNNTIQHTKRPLHLAREIVRSLQPTELSAPNDIVTCDTNAANTCTCGYSQDQKDR